METRAHDLIKQVKKQNEESMLKNYRTWAAMVASDISERGFHWHEPWSRDKTFSGQRGFIRYLRRIGFKVTIKSISREMNLYLMRCLVELDKPLRQDMY